MSNKCDIGLIGLAVMGENLALNISSHGFSVAVFNRTVTKTQEFIKTHPDKHFTGTFSLTELVSALKTPRKIIMMVKSGQPVDELIKVLVPLLEKGDILIDGGNSYYQDTQRRCSLLEENGINYIGLGVSGGEEGALNGPSLMPGGSLEAYMDLAPIFTSIAAKVTDGPCCSYVGSDGAGHYVKMVHNGIEYGDMQLIAEAYFIMREVLNISPCEQSEIFKSWNEGQLNSYLIEITADILKRVDNHTSLPMIDVILDSAGQKGTGKWTVQSALELGVPVPTITEAVFARFMSAYKAERQTASITLDGSTISQHDYSGLLNDIHDALYASKICSYAQGFNLLRTASIKYNWNLQLGDTALLWRGGCIIRAQFLDKIKEAFTCNPQLPNLMLDPYFSGELNRIQNNWRRVISICKQQGVPIPSFSASLDYYDSYRQKVLPANLIQAQRDYFGAHTYERTDKEGCFHSEWAKLPTRT
ncbi:NADP-dependent phosphogluconate dehydrogenase [Dendrosporobacter sp. 1207_IL3150]|uniref:NADP-dependent phosphogluconate dehydrogenase n=1 Tax=Dendrosporobacter sp. 1207_IL3150 TaxID=3084054 RepID=UPI002FD918A1